LKTAYAKGVTPYDNGNKKDQYTLAADIFDVFKLLSMVANIIGAILIFVLAILLAIPVATLIEENLQQ